MAGVVDYEDRRTADGVEVLSAMHHWPGLAPHHRLEHRLLQDSANRSGRCRAGPRGGEVLWVFRLFPAPRRARHPGPASPVTAVAQQLQLVTQATHRTSAST